MSVIHAVIAGACRVRSLVVTGGFVPGAEIAESAAIVNAMIAMIPVVSVKNALSHRTGAVNALFVRGVGVKLLKSLFMQTAGQVLWSRK